MTNFDPSSENSRAVMEMLRKACSKLGRPRIFGMLPKPMVLEVDDHDTGCQMKIYFAESGLPKILVWQASLWHSSIYEFNDNGKQMGVQTECMFACAALRTFFSDVHAAFVSASAAYRTVAELQKQAVEKQRSDALEHYHSVLNREDGL